MASGHRGGKVGRAPGATPAGHGECCEALGAARSAADTDGIVGTEDNAGATLAPDSLRRVERLGLNARHRVADNDGYGVFAALGDLVMTGPTRTNVNDLRAILIAPS